MEFVIYNVRVAILLIAFFLLYRLFLSRETFLRTNRFVILVAVLVSLSIPRWRLTLPQGGGGVVAGLTSSFTLDEFVVAANSANSANSAFSWLTWQSCVVALYWAGLVFFAFRVVWSIVQIVLMLRRGERIYLGGGVFLSLNDNDMAPFSWLRFISMSRKDYMESRDEILTHELAHIRCFHSLDLLLMDAICCLQWFNPASWLLRAELCAVHEYEADKAVLDSGVNAKQYQLLLIKKAAGARWSSVANSFNHSKLKSRITMMLRKESSSWARAKVLYALPIIGGAMIAFSQVSCNEDEVNASEGVSQVDPEESELSTLTCVAGRPLQVADMEEAMSLDSVSWENYPEAREILNSVSSVAEYMKSGFIDAFDIDRNNRVKRVITVYGEAFTVPSDDEEAFVKVDEMPVFPGGQKGLMEFLANEVKYPKAAQEQNIEGRVFIKFVVSKEGKVERVFPAKRVNPILDREAVRVVRAMPNWTPGRQGGVAVPVGFVVPINFRLD